MRLHSSLSLHREKESDKIGGVSSLANKVTNQRVFIWLVTAIGILLSPVLAWAICYYGYQMALIVLGLLIVAGWAFIARDRWWVPFPASLILGGTFYYGFKIPMHEMTLLICLFPLMLALATRWQGAIPGRSNPPPCMYLLTLYLVIHLIASLMYNKITGLNGAGNVVRSYMSALWPLILFFAYYFFGTSKYIRQAFFLMYLAALVRFVLGAYGYLNPGFAYIPGINYVPSMLSMGETQDLVGSDLRASSKILAAFSLCYIFIKRRTFWTGFHSIIIAFCTVGVFYGGGRLYVVSFFMTFAYLCFLYRNILLLGIIAVIGISGIALLNMNTKMIAEFPLPVQRAVASFIPESKSAGLEVQVGGSDEWHEQLAIAGRKRWLSSVGSTLFGNGMRPFNLDDWKGGDQLKVAEGNGSYEAAYWTILAVTGLVGLVLYMNVFRYLLADSLPLLWRRGIYDYQTSMAFIASFNIMWLIAFGWISGGFPSTELMFGLFAKTLHDDQKWNEKQEAAQKDRAESASASQAL